MRGLHTHATRAPHRNLPIPHCGLRCKLRTTSSFGRNAKLPVAFPFLKVAAGGAAMAAAVAAYMPPPPCSRRSPRGTHQTSCTSGALLFPAAAEVRWGNSATFSLKKVGCSSKKLGPTGRRRRIGMICSARYDSRGNNDDTSTLSEMGTLVNDLAKLNTMVNEANKGIGADVRNRVDVLFNRATLLKYSADRMVDEGGRVPVQLTATLKGLQREHASVVNIVRLAMQAGPVIFDNEDSLSKLNLLLKGVEGEVINNDPPQPLKVIVKEKEVSKPSIFETLIRQSSLKKEASQPSTFAAEKYVMSTPAAKSSSPLSAFRKEIERRVMEQLTGKKRQTPDSSVTLKEQKKEAAMGDAASENYKVAGLIENLPLRGRLPQRRVKEDVKDEAVSADTLSTETDKVPETQPQMLEESQDSSSLADAQPQESVVENDSGSEELDKLRRDLSNLEQQLSTVKDGSARAERAEAQLQQVTEELAATVPLDVHDQVVKLERESLLVARNKIAQVTADLKAKESMLSAVKQEMMAEQENLLGKVRELSGELSKRVSSEEVEAAVNNAVRELEKELRNALKRAESMQLELETNEKLLKQLQMEWDVERTSLRRELANVKDALTDVQMEQATDRAKLKEAMEKMQEMEDSLARLQQALAEAEEERIIREKNVLATVRALIVNMVKTKRAQLESSTPDATSFKTSKSLDGNVKSEATVSEADQTNSVEEVMTTMFSGEKAVALEAFFVMMGVLIQQESEKLETKNPPSGAADSIIKATKPVITLYYESSWEYAYLHYSADGAGWTALPGICMLNGIVVNNMPLKVMEVEGSSVEFVLTDGRGSWDCAPSGGNYHIKNSGTFLLSSGFIEQKR